jgi:hypothetical protein
VRVVAASHREAVEAARAAGGFGDPTEEVAYDVLELPRAAVVDLNMYRERRPG